MGPPPPGARPELLSSLLTPVYIAVPLLAIGALVLLVASGVAPPVALVIGAVVCVVLGVRMLPLTVVHAGPDRLHIRGLVRSFEVPFGTITGIEVRRFGGALSVMREVTVQIVDGPPGVDQVRFVGGIGFGDDAAAMRLAAAIDGWRASERSARGRSARG